jgi:hypothetical protein
MWAESGYWIANQLPATAYYHERGVFLGSRIQLNAGRSADAHVIGWVSYHATCLFACTLGAILSSGL